MMESNVNAVLFIYGRSAITLRWDSKLISHEMAMDTIDNIGKRFLTHFQGTILQFKVTENQDENGNIISITGIVLNLITPIYVIVIDGTRHMYDYNKVNYKQLRITSDQVFSKHESYLITEDGNFIIDRDIIISSMSSFQEMPKMLPDNNKKTRRINIEELKAHNTRQDCWIALNRRVYDITNFIKIHPGGDIILKSAGTDGTQLFNKYHSHVNPENMIAESYLGSLSLGP